MPANKNKPTVHDEAARKSKRMIADINARPLNETAEESAKNAPAPGPVCYSPNRHLENKLNYFIAYT